MRKTGIFYHPSFSRRSYLTQGTRLEDFPGAIEYLLKKENVVMFESPPIEEEWILKVHTPELILGVRADHLCSTAWHSAGGVVLAGEKIWNGEIDNAFAFIGAGGHHAGRDYFGGYCCFNDVVITITKLRELYGVKRFAILDTDAHHGDGTRDLVKDDPDVLHVCMCYNDYKSPDGTKIDVAVRSGWFGWKKNDQGDKSQNDIYFEKVCSVFPDAVRHFNPDLLFWYFGFDTHRGDYGDLGLTGECYNNIARLMVDLSLELCSGKLEVVLGGGSRADIAREVIPPVIEILSSYRIEEAVK